MMDTAMSEHDSETQEPNYARRLVYFAAERTLMSWVRTALGLMALGFVIDRFGLILGKITPLVAEHNPRALSFWAGDLMVVAGAVMALVAALRYWRFARNYHHNRSTRPGHGIMLSIVFAMIVALFGLVVAVFLLAVGH
jgi:putative membrane protein